MKKFLIVVLSLAVLLSASYTSYAAPTETYMGLQGYRILLNSVSFKDKVPSWVQRDAVRVTALSILKGTGDGSFHANQNLSREEALGIALRVAGLEGDAQSRMDQDTASLYSGIVNADTWAVGYIFAASDNGYISQNDIYTENWKSGVTREEFASYMGHALGYSPAYGADQSFVSSFSDSRLFDLDYTPYIEPVIESGIMAGYQNGAFGPKNGLTRGEAAVILGRVLDKYPERFNITKQSGLVYYMANNTDYTIKRADESLFVLSTDNEHGVVVLDNGNVGDRLKQNQQVDIYMKNGIPYLAEVISVSSQTIKDSEGVIKSADNNKVNIEIAGSVKSFYINPNTVFTVDGKKATSNELMPGQYVSFTSRNSNLLQLAIDSQIENPGYSQPGTFYLTGNVVNIDNGSMTIKDRNGAIKSLTLPSYVSIDIKPGDMVKVYLDNDGNIYSVDRVVGNMQYAYLYRGRLSSMVADKIQIDDVKKFDNFRWEDDVSLKLPVSDEMKVYKTDMEQSSINSYMGSYAYFITRMEYGEEKVYRAIIEDGHMKEYVDDIDRVDNVAGRITLPDTDMQISEGSIILKDGKMVTTDNLEEGQTVLALLDRMGVSNIAPLIMVLDKMPSVRIVKGEIDVINSTTFSADHVYEIDGNDWSRSRDLNELYINDDTYIIDYLNYADVISPDEFLNDRYERHPRYEGEDFYAVMDGEEVVGMVIYDSASSNSGPSNVRFVTAKYNGIANGGRMTVKDVLEYSSLTDKWTIGPSQGYVWTEDSLVIKDNRVSDIDVMKEGAPLYILVDNDMNALLIVEGDE